MKTCLIGILLKCKTVLIFLAGFLYIPSCAVCISIPHSVVDVEAIVLVFGIFFNLVRLCLLYSFPLCFWVLSWFSPVLVKSCVPYTCMHEYLHIFINNRTLNYAYTFACPVGRMYKYVHIHTYINFTVACKLTNEKLNHVFLLKHTPPVPFWPNTSST